MKSTPRSRTSLQLFALLTAALLATPTVFAKPIPENLGNGLDKLVESNFILAGKIAAPAPDKSVKANGSRQIAGRQIPTYDGYATPQAARYAANAIADPVSKKFMVDIVLGGRVAYKEVKDSLTKRFGSLQITAEDEKYRNAGVIEGYVALEDVPALAKTAGVRSIHLSIQPRLLRHRKTQAALATPSLSAPLGSVGTTFDQGVTQHRVDKINQLYTPGAPVNYDGTGVTIGFISDSFNTSGSNPNANQDVASKDLPGPGNSINSQPVYILAEGPDASTDEGRGMVQIGYKMAPRARLGFATAYGGEVDFANNIRGLAGIGPKGNAATFKADVICDDVSYFDEPFFQTGIVGNGVDDVAAAGVSYFSSAANDIGINGYDSDLRVVPNGTGLTALTNTALKNTNINLATVPANLYAGGFHNFDPSGDPNKQDVAQTVNVPTLADLAQYLLTDFPLIFQWDDPYDASDPVIGALLYHNTGTVDGVVTTSVTYDNTSTPPLPNFVQGQAYVIRETATSGDFDGIVSVIDPNGNTLFSQDTGTDEVVTFFAPMSGAYKIKVDHFASTTGSFDLDVNLASGTALVTTDLNLLVFDMNGVFVASKSLTSNNIASNRPIELETIMGDNSSQLQFVIARANVPTAPNPATHIRYVMPGNGLPNLGPAEYFTYGAPTTGGHAIAAGCMGAAAYAVFRPNIPESFTSPGPGMIYFDKNNNRLTPPEIREEPSVAAADGANTSFFGGDASGDSDSNPNFYGTSAASPHAASIAALVLQSHGGSGSVTPAQMRTILHNSAFPHDLDPYTATGTAQTANGGTVTVTIKSDNEAQTGTGMNDPNAISVSYSGPGHIASLTFNPSGTAAEGGNVTGGSNGVDATNNYFSNVSPGVVFRLGTKAFTLGTSLPNSLGLTDVVALPNNPAPAPSKPTDFWTLGLTFPTGTFTSGKSLHFTIGRGEQHSSDVENTVGLAVNGTTVDNAIGDIWGGGVLIPEGTIIPNGMKFSGTMDDGSTFSGRIINQIGHGYTTLDGYGFINAEAAVGMALQAPVQLTAVVSRKTHGAAGTFDVDMPLTGNPGIECRNGGTTGDFTLVFTFANPLTAVGGASVTGGTGLVSSQSIQNGSCVVNLTGVTNAQRLTVTLTGVSDNAGNNSASVAATVGILAGDTNADGFVNSADISQTKSQSGNDVSSSNFREDLTFDGLINSGDIALVKSKSGTALPAQ